MGALTHNGEVLQGLPGVASQVNYDNSDSGLSATQVQDAIDEVNEKLGTASTKDVPVSGNASTSQVVMGNDTRLSDARPASDVSAWAKANSKPSYNASEVGAEPNGGVSTGNKTFNVGGKLLLRTDSEGGNIVLTPPDGKHFMEMDINDNANLRMYFWDVDNQTMSGAITKSVAGFANIDDIVSKVNRFRDSFSNDSAQVPLSGSTHLNDITTTCFVNGQGTANGFPTDDWYFVITFIHSNPVYRTQVAFSMTGANNTNKTYTRMCQATSWSSWQQFADKSDISTLQSNFQAGVDSIYNACVAKGSTPASKSLSDVVAGIGNIPTNSYSTQTKTVTLSSSSGQPWTDGWYYGSTSVTFDFPHGVLGVSSISGGVNFFENGYAGPKSISGNTVNIGFTVNGGSKSMTITVYGY